MNKIEVVCQDCDGAFAIEPRVEDLECYTIERCVFCGTDNIEVDEVNK